MPYFPRTCLCILPLYWTSLLPWLRCSLPFFFNNLLERGENSHWSSKQPWSVDHSSSPISHSKHSSCQPSHFDGHQDSLRPHFLLPRHHVFSYYLCVVSFHQCRSHYHLDTPYLQTSGKMSSVINRRIKRPHGTNPCQQSVNSASNVFICCIGLPHTSSTTRTWYLPWILCYPGVISYTRHFYLTWQKNSLPIFRRPWFQGPNVHWSNWPFPCCLYIRIFLHVGDVLLLHQLNSCLYHAQQSCQVHHCRLPAIHCNPNQIRIATQTTTIR